MSYPQVITKLMSEHPSDSHRYERYVASGGYDAAKTALTKTRDELVEIVKESGLIGRGGALFSTGMKWSFLAPPRPAYLVVNGDESEPGTFKDRQILERDPHQMLEGIIIAAVANEVHEAFIYIRGEYPKPARRVQQAVSDAYANGVLGRGILGTSYDLDVTVHLGAGAYICGEETALLNSLEGKRGEPRLKPPYFPAAKGLYMLPTIVNNVETIANLPHIIANGAEWYQGLSDSEDAGTFLASISGHVKRPGNYEIPHGITWRELIYDIAGGIRDDNELKAWVPGGASAPWFVPDQHLDDPITKDACARAGSMLGSGAVIVMDHTTNVVAAAERLVRFFAEESCGQCTPCREGTTWLDMILQRMLNGAGREVDLALLHDVSDGISVGLAWPPVQTTICPLGPSAVSAVKSILEFFPEEAAAHAKRANEVPVTIGVES